MPPVTTAVDRPSSPLGIVRDFTRDLRDFVALAKPRITAMVVATSFGGYKLAEHHAPGTVDGSLPSTNATTLAMLLVGAASIVSGANALNMWIERDIDGHMRRTQNRPLPTGRMAPKTALVFGLALTIFSIPILAIGTNLVTALLGVLAHLLYVCAYTPMKQKSHWALFVGAVPGAIPPLMGWTAATARVDAGGLALFAILFWWQIPHFLAIALFRRKDYADAGLKVMPNVAGEPATWRAILNFTGALVASTLLLFPLGVAGRGYLVAAGLLGAAFCAVATWGFTAENSEIATKRSRWLFAYSIVYLVALFVAIALGA
ncbi:MAG TPA: heme o synthase [Polyangiaceae bacterium]